MKPTQCTVIIRPCTTSDPLFHVYYDLNVKPKLHQYYVSHGIVVPLSPLHSTRVHIGKFDFVAPCGECFIKTFPSFEKT